MIPLGQDMILLKRIQNIIGGIIRSIPLLEGINRILRSPDINLVNHLSAQNRLQNHLIESWKVSMI
jgi:hypothetical protein